MKHRGTASSRRAADMAPDALLVRRATADDLGTVVSLRLALLREYPDHPVYGRLRPDVESRARALFAAQLDADNEVVFIAEFSGAPVGLLRCVETVSSPLLLPERYCYVSSAFVKPEFRRRGILQALLERARGWCTERGLIEMRLHNVGSRESAAGAWDALGFEVVEQVRVLRLAPTPSRIGATDSAQSSAKSAPSARSTPQ
jgi:GNAT superfamily N-acetyltransferase